MNEHEISAVAATIAKSITEGIFAQADTRSPEQKLLDDLESCHSRSELYDVWRIRELVETLNFRVFACDEFPLSIRSRLNLSADSPASASVELNAILIQSWPLGNLASNLRLRPQSVLAASILHECGHLLTAKESIVSPTDKEKRAWQVGRELLEQHNLYGFCSHASFSILEANARHSYNDPTIVHYQAINGKSFPSLI